MQNSKRNPLPLLLALVAVLAVAIIAYRFILANRSAEPGPDPAAQSQGPTDSGASPQTQEGPLLADYDPVVYTEEGDAVSFTQVADGKPLVVNFWATWCPYCIEEFPDFQRIYDDYGDRVSFAFVDATDGGRETVEAASGWLAQNGYSFPAYYDSDASAMRMYGITGLPTTVVVSADGEIVAASSGMIDPVALRGLLDTLV